MANSLWVRIEQGNTFDEEELRGILSNIEEEDLNAAEATRALVGFVRYLWANDQSCAELVVGGDASASLIQVIISAAEEELDVLATAVSMGDKNEEHPVPCCSARGKEALTLIASYWCAHPEAPLLVVPDGESPPKRVIAALQDKSWTYAPMTAAHLGKLRQWAAQDPEARVGLAIEPSSS